MQNIERILSEAGVKPTAIRSMVMKEIIAIGHTFTLSDMEIRLETVDKSTLFRTLTLFLEHKFLHILRKDLLHKGYRHLFHSTS